MFRLTIQLPHEERHVDVPASRAQRLLTDVLRGMQLPLNTRCGQRGLCDGCMIELVRGNLQRAATGELLAASAEAQPLRGCEVSLPARVRRSFTSRADRCWHISRKSSRRSV